MTTKRRAVFRPPANTRRAKYWYIPSTPITAPPRGFRLAAFRESSPLPRGSSTYVYDPVNPERSRSADDVAVQSTIPNSNATEGGGVVTAATAAQLIATSGPLAAGTYYVEVAMAASGVLAAGKHLQCEHRNAADAATLIVRGLCPYGDSEVLVFQRVVVALNERIRVMQGAVVGEAAAVAHAIIRCYKLPI